MGYMNFKSPVLEKIFKRFKWTRNNTIQIFEQAEKEEILDYASNSSKSSKYTFQPIIFQFQCVVTTTDTYLRKLTKHPNKGFGILIINGEVISKKEIKVENVSKLLKDQLKELEQLLKNFDDKAAEECLDYILDISNHEHLHQGQLIVMFREAVAELPERFQKAWALG